MKTVTINLYELKELNEEAKEKAITKHAEFLLSINEEAHEITRKEAISSIELNDYLFYFDGEIAPVTTYTGKHSKAGISELNFFGETITL